MLRAEEADGAEGDDREKEEEEASASPCVPSAFSSPPPLMMGVRGGKNGPSAFGRGERREDGAAASADAVILVLFLRTLLLPLLLPTALRGVERRAVEERR